MGIRRRTEKLEGQLLSPYASHSSASRGRRREEPPCPVRTVFQRDRDRIVHAKAFRRLRGKTQVFLSPVGDHYRTRLTHSLEVAQIARTISKALRLNEDLTEAIALGHDLGHTPFGHAGEEVLNELVPGGFHHNQQSLRVVDLLEDGGLNLTWEVRDGILNHTGENRPATPEGKVARIADRIAYINHDIDDAIRAGVITLADLPQECLRVLGTGHSARINTLVSDVITGNLDNADIRMSPPVWAAMDRLRDYLLEHVYVGSPAKKEETKAKGMLRQLFLFLVEHPEEIYGGTGVPEGRDRFTAVADYIAGMTDRYAIATYQRYFLPSSWGADESEL